MKAKDYGLTKQDIIDSFVVNRRNKSLSPYFDVYFEISSYEGIIKINEPEKCSELKWVDINDLPNDMIDFEIEAIKNRQRNITFTHERLQNRSEIPSGDVA